MPLNDPLLPNASADAVAIFDQNFNQVFERARPMKVTVKENKKVMQHPLESGESVADHAVIEPIEIQISMVLQAPEYRSVYQEIRQAFKSSFLYVVQTKTATYPNMTISSMPHEENPDQFDIIPVALTFSEADFVTAKTGKLPPAKVKKKTQQSTVDTGVKQPKQVQDSPIKLLTDRIGRIFK